MVGKPNQTIPKAQLQPIPAFDEPFSRIIIDCVGPLPRTKSGNEYLLTIMCTSTHFPEAIPLRNFKTKSIVKALIKFITFVGLPKSAQSALILKKIGMRASICYYLQSENLYKNLLVSVLLN